MRFRFVCTTVQLRWRFFVDIHGIDLPINRLVQNSANGFQDRIAAVSRIGGQRLHCCTDLKLNANPVVVLNSCNAADVVDQFLSFLLHVRGRFVPGSMDEGVVALVSRFVIFEVCLPGVVSDGPLGRFGVQSGVQLNGFAIDHLSFHRAYALKWRWVESIFVVIDVYMIDPALLMHCKIRRMMSVLLNSVRMKGC